MTPAINYTPITFIDRDTNNSRSISHTAYSILRSY